MTDEYDYVVCRDCNRGIDDCLCDGDAPRECGTPIVQNSIRPNFRRYTRRRGESFADACARSFPEFSTSCDRFFSPRRSAGNR